jgi:hypothetical protein
MEDILQSIAETCSGLEEIDITTCSDESVLRAVAIRASAVCGVQSALDIYTYLKSLGGRRKKRTTSRFESYHLFCMQVGLFCCLNQSWSPAKIVATMHCFKWSRTASFWMWLFC